MMGNRKYARLPLGLNLYWRGGHNNIAAFSRVGGLILGIVQTCSLHVGAPSDWCVKRGENSIHVMAKVQFLLYTTTITLNVSKYGFCM